MSDDLETKNKTRKERTRHTSKKQYKIASYSHIIKISIQQEKQHYIFYFSVFTTMTLCSKTCLFFVVLVQVPMLMSSIRTLYESIYDTKEGKETNINSPNRTLNCVSLKY